MTTLCCEYARSTSSIFRKVLNTDLNFVSLLGIRIIKTSYGAPSTLLQIRCSNWILHPNRTVPVNLPAKVSRWHRPLTSASSLSSYLSRSTNISTASLTWCILAVHPDSSTRFGRPSPTQSTPSSSRAASLHTNRFRRFLPSSSSATITKPLASENAVPSLKPHPTTKRCSHSGFPGPPPSK